MSVDTLLASLEAMPAGSLIPRDWVRDQVAALADRGSASPSTESDTSIDLTVEQLGARVGRAPSTIRTWAKAGLLPGAYRLFGREWRFPPSAVAAFLERQRVDNAKTSHASHASRRDASPDISSWRRHMPKAS